MREVLLINGPCGVGKTRAGFALSDALNARKLGHVLLDLDALAQVFPRPQDDPFGGRMALRQLSALLPFWGMRPIVLARVIETEEELAELRAALSPCRITHVVLTAEPHAIAARLARRETGAALAWHIGRAAELDEALRSGPSRDLTIDTSDLDPDAVALELQSALDWPGLKEDP